MGHDFARMWITLTLTLITVFFILQSVDVMNQSLAISHFLNCLLMSGQSAVPPNLNDEVGWI